MTLPAAQSTWGFCWRSHGKLRITSGPERGHLYRSSWSDKPAKLWRTRQYSVRVPNRDPSASCKGRGRGRGWVGKESLSAYAALMKPIGEQPKSRRERAGADPLPGQKILVSKENEVFGPMLPRYRSSSPRAVIAGGSP